MSDFLLSPVPNDAAAAWIKNKSALSAEIFKQLHPKVKSRAFTVAGIEDINLLQSIRDTLAELPKGSSWDEVRKNIIADLPLDVKNAKARANLLIKTHGFQAYSVAAHAQAEKSKDAFPYRQYLTAGDEAVRSTHAALDEVIAPTDSEFWRGHTPPWQWGCRCRWVNLTKKEAEAESKNILSGKKLELAIKGTLAKNPAQHVNIKTDEQIGKSNPYSFVPHDYNIPLSHILNRYDKDLKPYFYSARAAQPYYFSGDSTVPKLSKVTSYKYKIDNKSISSFGSTFKVFAEHLAEDLAGLSADQITEIAGYLRYKLMPHYKKDGGIESIFAVDYKSSGAGKIDPDDQKELSQKIKMISDFADGMIHPNYKNDQIPLKIRYGKHPTYDLDSRDIKINPEADIKYLAHEIFHSVEQSNTDILQKNIKFLLSKIKDNDTIDPIQAHTPLTAIYTSITFRDQWHLDNIYGSSFYLSKKNIIGEPAKTALQSSKKDIQATELLSFTAEKIFDRDRNFLEFCSQSPDLILNFYNTLSNDEQK
jgi:Phage Mu protein F like protein